MKRKFWRKKLMAMTVLMSLLLSATGCSEDPDAQTSSTKSSGSGDSWVIYWYLCGSDLESNAAAATTDLQEMLQVTLPENVKVVIQTGGAKKWQDGHPSGRLPAETGAGCLAERRALIFYTASGVAHHLAVSHFFYGIRPLCVLFCDQKSTRKVPLLPRRGARLKSASSRFARSAADAPRAALLRI